MILWSRPMKKSSICRVNLLALAVGTAGALVTPITQAEVKSLTSSELTDTYIKDSTIIVTPKEAPQTQQKTYSSLTIAPVESSDQDIDELKNSQQHLKGSETAVALSDEYLRNASIETALTPAEPLEILSYKEYTEIPVADLLDDERYRVPEGDFERAYFGDNLSISREGEQFTFSIGNIPGIEQINIPQGMNEAPVELIPRDGGGFDLTINIPQNN